jgi:hypothetical protein
MNLSVCIINEIGSFFPSFVACLLAFLLGSLPDHSHKSKRDGSGPVTDTSEP